MAQPPRVNRTGGRHDGEQEERVARRASEPITIKRVAERAGVGTTSVSRVLSGHPDVSERMRETVLRAAEECGYEIDLLARALRSGRSRTIGILVGDILNPFLAEITAGAAERLRAEGYAVVLSMSNGEPGRDTELIRVLLQRRVDGIILSVSDEGSPGLASLLERADRPVVLLDREVAVPDISAVLTNHRQGMGLVIDHLVGLGHRDIGLLIGQLAVRPSRERRAGFVEAMGRHGLPVVEDWIADGALSEGFARRVARQMLTASRRPTALVCGGNQLTTGVLSVVEELGLPIPEALSVVGCDDVPLTRLYRPHITVLARDAYAMGDAAASQVLDALDGSREPRHTLLDPQLVVRGSTHAPAVGSKASADA